MSEIFSNYRHFTTEDKQWSLSAKPESNLCLSVHIVAITRQLFFEFFYMRINFYARLISRLFNNRENREIKYLRN